MILNKKKEIKQINSKKENGLNTTKIFMRCELYLV